MCKKISINAICLNNSRELKVTEMISGFPILPPTGSGKCFSPLGRPGCAKSELTVITLNPIKYIMNKLKTLLIAGSVLAFTSVASAAIVDTWTFTDAVAPQNSDIQGDTIDFWDPALAGNSHDVGAGVLTWGYVPPEGGFKTSSSAFLGGTWLGQGSAIPQLVLTIDAKNISFVDNSSYGWQFTGPAGAIATGFVRARIAYFNGNVTMRMEGTDAEFNGGTLYNQADYTSITDLQLTFTWDFVNNTMSTVATGSGELAAGGTGTISLSNSVAQDLSGVTNLAAFRTRAQGTGGSFMQLDTVTISAVPEPSTFALLAGFATLGLVMVRRRRLQA